MSESPDPETLRTLIVGESSETQELRRLITRIGPTGLPVWIEGETGVGKEQVALALHQASGCRGAFVPVNVCAVSDSMFEDAFFGHVRGAFTGAHDNTPGFFGEADEGTLFLDEISSLAPPSQAKLLRAVETRRYRPVGARSDRVCRARVVAASNEPYELLVRSGRLRLDLAFRLRGGALRVPPLRLRPSDVSPLATHFLQVAEGTRDRTIDADALRWLAGRYWSGNVRELRQVIECACALSLHRRVTLDDVCAAARMLAVDEVLPLGATESNPERDELVALLAHCGWDTLKVATALRIDRRTVYRRMRRFDIDLPSARQGTWAPNGRPMGANGRKPDSEKIL